jgi:hypothetical protein
MVSSQLTRAATWVGQAVEQLEGAVAFAHRLFFLPAVPDNPLHARRDFQVG